MTETIGAERGNRNPFRLPLKNSRVARCIESLLGLSLLAKHYDARPAQFKQPTFKPTKEDSQVFLRYTQNVLDVGLCWENEEVLESIPETGPIIFISNHPLGGLEGVATTDVLLARRPDTLVLTNQLLTNITELSPVFVGVDVLSNESSNKNTTGLRRVFQHLAKGGAVLIYPAGQVSAINTANWQIEDREWNALVGKLVKRYRAHCLPMFVHAKNSRLFYFLALIHPRLRLAMLARELSNKVGKRFSVTLGPLIAPDDLAGITDSEAVTQYLRMVTDLLGQQKKHESQSVMPVRFDALELISSCNEDKARVQAELDRLEESRLIRYQNYSVYCASTQKLGSVMREIAIARERTFRAAGEGTGFAEDSDRFDPYYQQLFVWDDVSKCVVGGYRLGHTDDIIAAQGIKGLYSRSLYKFDVNFVEKLGSTLELGRSFIVPEYQRQSRPLDLLWQGIGAYMVKNPGFHTLFGCVSISQEHSALARAFISDSLMESFRAEQSLLNDVSPVAPLKVKGKVWTAQILSTLGSISVINKLVGYCDPGKTIPVLLRQYLALNGRFISFSVNKHFNESLDGLVLVDLRKTPKKYLVRYLGKDGYAEFSRRWQTPGEYAA